MLSENRLAFWLSSIACVLALCVVMLGAYTRLKDAGLGCPDWPGCYGMIVVPETSTQIAHAESSFPGQALNASKAWIEMTHRYVAGSLGLLVLMIGFLVFKKRNLPRQPVGLALGLIGLVIFQALLGKWTVTLRLLPLVVMSHLLGGILLISLLGLMALRLGNFFQKYRTPQTFTWMPWSILGLIIIFGQILLGGWTSSNYAALVCPDFPFCQGKLWPSLNLHHAFQFWMSIGPNFQGGILDNTARVTIHMMHRIGALITFFYLSILALTMVIKSQNISVRRLACFLLLLLFIQISLGIANVVWLLPMSIAVAHNGIAAVLMLSMVALNYAVYRSNRI